MATDKTKEGDIYHKADAKKAVEDIKSVEKDIENIMRNQPAPKKCREIHLRSNNNLGWDIVKLEIASIHELIGLFDELIPLVRSGKIKSKV